MSQTGTVAQTTDVFSEIETWFKAKEAEVVQFAQTFGKDVETYLELGVEQLAGIVGSAVLAEAPKLISGQEKFGNATDNVVMAVEAAGKIIAQNTAGMLVQKAVIDAQTVAQNAQPAQ